jgi:hypothetical protein
LSQKEQLFLAPADQDREAFSSFLTQPGTGITRLMPREHFDGVLLTRGGGAYYSFASQEHAYGFGSDLSLERGQLKVGFAGADFGFLTKLGDIPIESVTPDTSAKGLLRHLRYGSGALRKPMSLSLASTLTRGDSFRCRSSWVERAIKYSCCSLALAFEEAVQSKM